MTNSIRIAVATAALLLAGAGCGKPQQPATPSPAPEAPAAAPSAPGLPRMTEQPVEEDDGLDAALKDLEAVE